MTVVCDKTSVIAKSIFFTKYSLLQYGIKYFSVIQSRTTDIKSAFYSQRHQHQKNPSKRYCTALWQHKYNDSKTNHWMLKKYMLRQHINTKLQEGLLKRVTTCDWFQKTEIWTSKCKTMNLVLAFLYAFMYIFLSTNLEHRSWSFQPFWVVGSWRKEDSLHWRTVRVLFWDLLDLLTSRLRVWLTQCPLLFLLLEQPVKKQKDKSWETSWKGQSKCWLVFLASYFTTCIVAGWTWTFGPMWPLWPNVSRASTSVVVKTN